jgi:hypothetical protein
MLDGRRHLGLVFSVAATLALTVSLVVANPQLALAGTGRWYSVLFDYSGSGVQTGALSVHAYTGLSVPTGTNCNIVYADDANPIYLTQWVTFNQQATEHVEVGYAWQCNSVGYRFWGYRTGGTWHRLGEEFLGLDANGHYFATYQLTTDGRANWYFEIDGVRKPGTYSSALKGQFVDVGIETSYQSNAAVNHWFSQLQLTINQSPWQPWGSGSQFTRVDAGASLCGIKRSTTQWSAAEANPCF